jgi:hypothetical protein
MRFRAILGVSLSAALLVLAGPAVTALAYPPTICPTLSVSTTNPLPGQTIAVTGTNFEPQASVKLELRSPVRVLKTVKSDGSGSFATSVKLPAGVTGKHTLVAVGGGSTGGAGCGIDPFQTLNIQNNGGGNSSASTGTSTGTNGGGGTAFTGLDVLALIAAAVVLVGAGVMLNVSGKRRKYASRH